MAKISRKWWKLNLISSSSEKDIEDEKAEIRAVLIKSFELNEEKIKIVDGDIKKLKAELYGDSFRE